MVVQADRSIEVVMPMGNPEALHSAGNAPRRRVALGIEDHLDDFARANAAESWKQFALANPMEWKSQFLDVMNDPQTGVLFNLRGIDVWGGVSRAAQAVRPTGNCSRSCRMRIGGPGSNG